MNAERLVKKLKYVHVLLTDEKKTGTAKLVSDVMDRISNLKENTAQEIDPIIDELREIYSIVSDMGYGKSATKIAAVGLELARRRR